MSKDISTQKNNEDLKESRETGLANALVIVMSLVFIVMSAMMIFIEGVETIYLCYAVCAAAVIAGIYMIVRYFMTDAYRNMNAYGFSIGTLLVILGICGLLRAQAMSSAFITILGVILLLSGIIVLQHSLDLRRMDDVVWMPVIVISALLLICSVVVILQPMAERFAYDEYVWWMILIGSSLSLIINIYTRIRIHFFQKKENKQAKENIKTETAADLTDFAANVNGSEEKAEAQEVSTNASDEEAVSSSENMNTEEKTDTEDVIID